MNLPWLFLPISKKTIQQIPKRVRILSVIRRKAKRFAQNLMKFADASTFRKIKDRRTAPDWSPCAWIHTPIPFLFLYSTTIRLFAEEGGASPAFCSHFIFRSAFARSACACALVIPAASSIWSVGMTPWLRKAIARS